MDTSPAPSPVLAFERARRARLLRGRAITLVSLVLASALLSWAFSVAGLVSAAGSGQSLQNIVDFAARMNPGLEADRLFQDHRTPGSIAHWYQRWPIWRELMIETVEIAYVSLLLSTALGLIAAMLAASTTNPIPLLRWSIHRLLELIRTVPDLIMAILFVTLFGLGPLAGVLTLTLSGIGVLGRFFGEALENVDLNQRDALRAAGADHLQQIRFGLLPQIMPVFVSFIFLRLETSISSATTLGLVGAGGIGTELIRAMDYNQYQSYLAILLLILVVIVLADISSDFVRQRMSLMENSL